MRKVIAFSRFLALVKVRAILLRLCINCCTRTAYRNEGAHVERKPPFLLSVVQRLGLNNPNKLQMTRSAESATLEKRSSLGKASLLTQTTSTIEEERQIANAKHDQKALDCINKCDGYASATVRPHLEGWICSSAECSSSFRLNSRSILSSNCTLAIKQFLPKIRKRFAPRLILSAWTIL